MRHLVITTVTDCSSLGIFTLFDRRLNKFAILVDDRKIDLYDYKNFCDRHQHLHTSHQPHWEMGSNKRFVEK